MLALLASPAQSLSFASEGKFTSFLSTLDWEPDCRRPTLIPPRTEFDRELSLAAIKRYATCVNEQAASDRSYATARIEEGRSQALKKLMTDIERLP